MIEVRGVIHEGSGDFTKRMTKFRDVFTRAVGEELFPGTLNEPREHFRIEGVHIDEPDQDLLFEICRVNGLWAYRIRPYRPADGGGGHGDHILEIACGIRLRKQADFNGSDIRIAPFR
jgi:CTP-dependent riboflavin kinase